MKHHVNGAPTDHGHGVHLPSVELVSSIPASALPSVVLHLAALLAAASARLTMPIPAAPKAPASPCVKAKDIARIFDLTLGRVYELARTGRIPYIPVGKRAMRFDPEAVRKGLASLGLTE